MSLRIEAPDFDPTGKNVCGGCEVTVNDTRIFEGAVVLVRKGARIDINFNLADSRFYGKVVVSEGVVRPLDLNGVIHYMLPIKIIGTDGMEIPPETNDILSEPAHEFKLLP